MVTVRLDPPQLRPPRARHPAVWIRTHLRAPRGSPDTARARAAVDAGQLLLLIKTTIIIIYYYYYFYNQLWAAVGAGLLFLLRLRPVLHMVAHTHIKN